MTGFEIQYLKHVRLEFGEYVQTHEDHDNHMLDQTVGAICLGPTGNRSGAHYFLHLTTGLRITRTRWTALPMPREVIARVNTLGRQQNMPVTLAFGDQMAHKIPDQLDDFLHDDDDDSSFEPSDTSSDDDDFDADVVDDDDGDGDDDDSDDHDSDGDGDVNPDPAVIPDPSRSGTTVLPEFPLSQNTGVKDKNELDNSDDDDDNDHNKNELDESDDGDDNNTTCKEDIKTDEDYQLDDDATTFKSPDDPQKLFSPKPNKTGVRSAETGEPIEPDPMDGRKRGVGADRKTESEQFDEAVASGRQAAQTNGSQPQ